MDTCLQGLSTQICHKKPLGPNKYPRFWGLKKLFSENSISKKYLALIAFFQTGTRATQISMTYVAYTKEPNGLKISQLKRVGDSGGRFVQDLPRNVRNDVSRPNLASPVSPTRFICEILRPFGSLVYKSHDPKILVALVPV